MLIKLLTEERPDRIAVAFDKGPPTERLAQYAEYKAGRTEAPDEFREQMGLIREVLETLSVPIVEVEGHEADDAFATLAVRARDRGMEAVIVTADRDFFQLVGPDIRVMFNRKGLSDIVDYDQGAVEARFGLPPGKYLDYVALKGDPSDNIPGVPGVGEKTASRLVQEHGSVEGVLANVEALSPKLATAIAEAGDQLRLNKDLARLRTDLDLDIDPDACALGDRDDDAVRRLFNSLEFRTLLERLEEAGVAPAAAETKELTVEEARFDDVASALSESGPLSVSLVARGPEAVALGGSSGDGAGRGVVLDGTIPEPVARWLADPTRPKWVHDAKELQAAALRLGIEVEGVAFDTLLAGYLLDPAEATYPLPALSERYLGVDVLGRAETPAEAEGQLPLGEAWREPAAEAAAVALLAPAMVEKVERAGVRQLFEEVELPLARVLARMQAAGVALDIEYLKELSETLGDRMPKGQLSTDASVLEKLRDRHPIVDALLSYRELAKLKSTYLDALPQLVVAGRLHTTFNQVGAATGRLSSLNPNLQNIPVRGETGRQIRKAFVAAPGHLLVVADYSQIELRVLAHLSGDEALAQRLGIPPDEAQEFIDAYFAGFPKIREFLDRQVAFAAAEGFTATILGRRRYLPELQSPNPRIRDLGRRMALNAPIQGSAADIMKLAMIRVDAAMGSLPATMVLTVHDELVFEVREEAVDEVAGAARQEMEAAYELSVPLRVDVGSGANWADAAPAGH